MKSDNFRSYLEGKGNTSKSVVTHLKHLTLFLNWCEDERIEPEQCSYNELLGYVKHLKTKSNYHNREKNLKAITVRTYLNSLNHYFAWNIQRGISADNPVRYIVIKGIERHKVTKVLDRGTLDQLYSNYLITEEQTSKISYLSSQRNKVVIGLLVFQGLNVSEILNMEISALKLEEGKVYVAGGQRSNERTLKLEAVQMLELMTYQLKNRNQLLELTEKKSNKLFVSSGSSEEFKQALGGLIKRLKKQEKQLINYQHIRASVITYWLKKYNLRQVQYMAGHRYVSSTEAYLVNDLDDLQEDISQYHPIS